MVHLRIGPISGHLFYATLGSSHQVSIIDFIFLSAKHWLFSTWVNISNVQSYISLLSGSCQNRVSSWPMGINRAG
jgi:hypothetical protein